jgi:hypothetical protein
MSNAHFVQAIERFGGMYGSAFKDGIELLDAIEVGGREDIQKMDMALVGQIRTGHKPGRVSADGTLRIQKFDSSWELFAGEFLNTPLSVRRANRGTAKAGLRYFDLKVQHDDPETGGKEVWQLEGCQIWSRSLGINITDEIIEREYPLTWENARPIETFTIDRLTGQITQVHSVNQ